MNWWDFVRAGILAGCIATAYVEYQNIQAAKAAPKPPKRQKKKIMPVDYTGDGGRSTEVGVSDKSGSSSRTRPRKVFKKLEKKKLGPGKNAPLIIFYSTLTGSTEKTARAVHAALSKVMTSPPQLLNIDYVDDIDEYFLSPTKYKGYLYLLIVPSYETESPLDFFIESLKETYNDFRVDSRPLHKLAGFSVFGLGDTEGWPEEHKFCYQARQIDKLLGKLGCTRIFPMGTACVKTNLQPSVDEYLEHLIDELENPSEHQEQDIVDSDDEGEDKGQDMMDVEDLGKAIDREAAESASESQSCGTGASGASGAAAPKAMVAKDSPTHKALTKQGYTVVGSHSGVKICRWTKSALRGRGSCYKYAFYGIKSHLCMETTPSLSCSNKCVFCWRHGTNPVGTTWRWQVDQPQDIINGALEGHYKKIKQMRGVPGVQAARFAEAFKVRHCALSLVGEPIFYPHINEFLGMLHEKHISSFLVCNAQHPKELRALKRATQLYVSIDASDKESLRKVDRPLHRDFWERMMECLDIIREKTNQRTVYRLTLVKGFNADEVEGYADLIERGMPAFVEVKGVTFCGNSATQQLTMQNVPFYEEVQQFVEALNYELEQRGLGYDLATEHAHSCCVLLAQTRFKIEGKWHTHIDYDRYFELLESGVEFGPMDYVAETPAWAYYGSKEQGFNPEDVPHRRGKPVASEPKASELVSE